MSLLRLALGAALLGLSLAPASAAAQSAPDLASLRAIEDQVQHLRGLHATDTPPVQVLDQAALRQYLTDELERDYLPSERESDQKELLALGLIGPGDDLLQIQLDLLSDEVVGLYDADTKSMYVVGDAAFGPTERITYAHEFTHALQDQHYDLRALAPKHPLSNDRSLAAHALIEGDAVLLQTLWAETNLTQDELLDVARASASGGDDVLSRVPPIVRAELLFPYVDGLSFVRQTYRQAGNDYAALDAVFQHPPTSTAQVLHPDKYRAHVEPVDVSLPDLAAALGPDWRHVGAGVLGELDTRVLLQQYGDRLEAIRVAGGWSGDSWQLVERDGQSAIVLSSVWESEEAATNFFSAYGRGLRARFAAAAADVASPTRLALSTQTAATDLRLDGRTVLAVIAPDRPTADALVAAVVASAP